MWHWSGVYHRTNDAAPGEPDRTHVEPPPANPENLVRNLFATTLQTAVAVLRGEDTEQTRLTRARFDEEWGDEIARIQACKGHDKLNIAQVRSDQNGILAITSAVKNDAGRHLICELMFTRQADGSWKLERIDVEPADNEKRDTDRFRKDNPETKQIEIGSN
jgi:hypothetical protein